VEDKRLPFLAHLEELKTRLVRAILVAVVGVVACFFMAEWIFDFLAAPLVQALRRTPEIHFQTPLEVFFVNVKLALVAGLIVTAPHTLAQLWLFVAPGLYRNERRTAASFVLFGSAFFFGGVAFAYYLVLPYGFDYLLGFAYDRAGNFSIVHELAVIFGREIDYAKLHVLRASIKPTIMMGAYISLVLKLLLAFGLIFELPLVLYFLARVGLVTHRGLWCFFRYWVVLSFLLAAILTPPDVFTQAMMAVPLILMYLGGLVAAFFITRAREARERKTLGYAEDEDPEDEDPEDEPDPPASP
jgi:sec-independent protein translocase protein TatC